MFPYYFLNCLVTYVAFQSVQKAILFTLLVRAFDSTWFFAVSQCNHITMQIHTDIHNDNWLNLQVISHKPFKFILYNSFHIQVDWYMQFGEQSLQGLVYWPLELSNRASVRHFFIKQVSVIIMTHSNSLFPTMPRHNFKKIQPYVQELCKKHNINYYVKPMGQALGEIFS